MQNVLSKPRCKISISSTSKWYPLLHITFLIHIMLPQLMPKMTKFKSCCQGTHDSSLDEGLGPQRAVRDHTLHPLQCAEHSKSR